MKKLFFYGLLLSLFAGFTSCSPETEEETTAIIMGYIIDSQTGDGLANATVYLTSDLSATGPENAMYTVTTDANGMYLVNDVPLATYIGFVMANGCFQQNIDPIECTNGGTTVVSDPTTIVAQPAVGDIRIVLTWGQNPYDLDSHLTGPSLDGYGFHMFFMETYTENANLDVDDQYSYGPETTTITTLLPGKYRYSVHNYSDQFSTGAVGIKNSPAKVEIYDHNGLLGEYTAPTTGTADANTWRVLDVNVDANGNYTVAPINTYIYASSYSTDTDFRSAGGKKALKYNKADF